MIINKTTNGIIKIINNSIYKTSKNNNRNIDNIYYEYLVGLKLNKYIKKYPLFIKTRDLYLFDSEKDKLNFYKNKPSQYTKLKKEFLNNIKNIDFFCANRNLLLLKIDYAENIGSFYDFIVNYKIEKNIKYNFFCYDIIIILYQIYYTLYSLNNTFTHYDLGNYNVLIQNTKKPIIINNKITGKKHKFNTTLRPIFIDYATAYIKDNNPNIVKYLCSSNNCTIPDINTNCGEYGGFLYFTSNNEFNKYNFYRNSHLYSNTHDLYLVNVSIPIIKNKLDSLPDSYSKNQLLYIINNLNYIDKYGTPPIKSKTKNKKINTIEDIYIFLDNTINNHEFISEFELEH